MNDPDSVDVDATTLASVLMPGNVGLLAQWIQEETSRDLFSIITEEPYSSDYDTCLNRAIEEHGSGARPVIAGHVDHIENYGIAAQRQSGHPVCAERRTVRAAALSVFCTPEGILTSDDMFDTI